MRRSAPTACLRVSTLVPHQSTVAGYPPRATKRRPPPAPPAWQPRASFDGRPPMGQFIVLSILLHMLAIMLFGAPRGGSREGHALFGSLDVVIADSWREPYARPRLEREVPAEPRAVPLPSIVPPPPVPDIAPSPAAAPKAAAVPPPPATAPAPLPPVAVPPPAETAAAPLAPVAVPPLLDRIVVPDRAPDLSRFEVPPPARARVEVVPPIPMTTLAPLAAPRVERQLAAPPKIDAPAPPPVLPRIEAPPIERVQVPRVERQLAQPPKIEAPALEAPKVDAPKVEAPKVEAPEVEAPKVEAPKVDAPKAEAPRIVPPAAEPSAPRAPATESSRPAPAPAEAPRQPQPPAASPFRSPPAAESQDYDPTAPAPALDADAMRRRAGELARQGTGNRALLAIPMPPVEKPKTTLESAIEKARKPDCRTAYQGLGLLAAVPLIANEFGEGTCRW